MKRHMATTAAALLMSLAPALAGTQATPDEILQATPEMQSQAQSPETTSSTVNGELAGDRRPEHNFLRVRCLTSCSPPICSGCRR